MIEHRRYFVEKSPRGERVSLGDHLERMTSVDENIVAHCDVEIEQVQPDFAANVSYFATGGQTLNADDAHRNGDTHAKDPSERFDAPKMTTCPG